MSWDKQVFKEKLVHEHQFPGIYLFKFIVPVGKADEVMNILPKGEITKKASKNNNYLSISLRAQIEMPDMVIEVYEKAANIEGIIAL